MANEDKKDFNAMLNDSKDMPKFEVITDEKSIQKYVLFPENKNFAKHGKSFTFTGKPDP